MRNGLKWATARFAVALLVPALVVATLAGCGGKAARDARAARRAAGPAAASAAPAAAGAAGVLGAGYAALEAQQFNEAVARAEEFLQKTPHGEGSAEALYLKGRANEGRNAAGVTADEARDNLQAARAAYIEALGMNPRQPLEAYLRTSLGNVAYFQDDYQTAIAQLTAAYDNLDNDELKAWALYRVGLSQQRQAQFDQADATFAAVLERHANTIPAQRARERQGARAFYVQLATFAQPAAADRAIADLKRQGVAATRVAGPEGRAFLRAGPIASYAQAQYLKNRFTEKYPDAVILP